MHLMTVSLGENLTITLNRFSGIKEPYQITIKDNGDRMVLDFKEADKAISFINGIIETSLKDVEEKML